MSDFSNNDSPAVSLAPATSFTFFLRLPQEIRDMTWILHLDAKPRLIQVMRRTPSPEEIVDLSPKDDLLWSDEEIEAYDRRQAAHMKNEDVNATFIPGGLHVCQESRAVATKVYSRVDLGVRPYKSCVWFGLDLDTLGIMHEPCNIWHLIETSEVKSVAIVVFKGFGNFSLARWENDMYDAVQRVTTAFSSLKKLHLLRNDVESELPKPLTILQDHFFDNYDAILDRHKSASRNRWKKALLHDPDPVARDFDIDVFLEEEFARCDSIYDARRLLLPGNIIATAIRTKQEFLESFE
jgi:hypothetical protein